MKKIFLVTLIIFSSAVFGQEKNYRFLYDFHQTTILDKDENAKMPAEIFTRLSSELNKSYEVEVVASSTFSFIKLVEKLDNDQDKFYIKVEPEPKWFLNDFDSNSSYEFVDLGKNYVKDTVQTIVIKPTRNSKKILGFDAKEFIAEDNFYNYSFWLVKFKNISVSPIKTQFKDYIVVAAEIIAKNKNNSVSERKINYILKNMTEEKPFDFNRLIPKKYLSRTELENLLNKINSENNMGVDKD